MRTLIYFIIVSWLFYVPLKSQAQDHSKTNTGSQDYRITNTQIISFYKDQDIGQLEKSYEYDSRGNLIELHTQYKIDEVLGHSFVVYNTYNDDLLIEQKRGYKEFPSSHWFMPDKVLSFYDNQRRLILRENYFKVEVNAEWKLMAYSTFDHIEDGKHTIEKHFSQNNTGIRYTEHCYYDESFRLLERSKYTDNASIPEEELTIKYDTDGKILQTIEKHGGVTKEDYFYENDSLIRKELFKWTSEGWSIREREINTYDNNGDRISEKMQQYPSDGWDNYQLLENTYDDHHNLIEQIDYRWEGNDWVLRHQFFHEWELNNSLGINPDNQLTEDKNHLLFFPNLTAGVINITGLTQSAEIKIYSNQGQLLKSEQQAVNTIDISDLPVGVYLMTIISGGEVVTKAIVKR